jgi:hypothetical protein
MPGTKCMKELRHILHPLSSAGLLDDAATSEDRTDRYCYPVEDYRETYVAYSAGNESTDTEVFF